MEALLLTVAAFYTLITSCGALHAEAKTPIVYWYFSVTDDQHDFLQLVVETFNKVNPTIRIEGQRMSGNMYDKTLTAIAGGAVPDVLHFERSAVIEWLASKGEVFEPLDAYLAPELRERDAFLPMARDEIYYQQQTWALPFGTDIRGLFWHIDVLEETGMDSTRGPESLHELDSWARKLTEFGPDDQIIRLGFAPWIYNWNLQGWFWTFGGGVFDYGTRKPTINIPENLAALKWVQSYAERFGSAAVRLSASWPTFASRQLAMCVGASPHLLSILKANPQSLIGADEVPWPEGGTNGTWSGGYCHVIPKGSKFVPEAAEFINYLTSTETQVWAYDAVDLLPTTTQAFREVIRRPRDQAWIRLISQLPVSHGRPPLWLAVHIALNTAQDDLLNFRKTPEQILQEVQKHMELQFAEIMGW